MRYVFFLGMPHSTVHASGKTHCSLSASLRDCDRLQSSGEWAQINKECTFAPI